MTLPTDYGDPDWLLERLYKFRREVQHVEREYLELRVLLRNAEAALRSDPEKGELQARVHHFKTRLKDLEGRYPWISSEKAREMIWSPPSG